jgi:hypothetical protein
VIPIPNLTFGSAASTGATGFDFEFGGVKFPNTGDDKLIMLVIVAVLLVLVFL